MIYSIAKNLIERKEFKKDDMIKKLNVFFMFEQLSDEEYKELLDLINNPKIEENALLEDVEQEVAKQS